jgi:hypothetical protein
MICDKEPNSQKEALIQEATLVGQPRLAMDTKL